MVKNYNTTPKIKEGWSGPGRRDDVITHFKPEYDGLHIDLKKKGYFEWWYFDARLEGGYTAVGFFRAAHERTGKTAVEIVIYKPNGERYEGDPRYILQRAVNKANSQILWLKRDSRWNQRNRNC